MTSAPKVTVLLADDEALIRRATGRLLQAMGFEVRAVGDGFGAEAVLREVPSIDLVLLDFMMPGRSANDTVSALRVLKPEIPIVLCSGYALSDVASQLLHVPGVHQLQKPFSRAQLSELFGRLGFPATFP
jgi:two-component system cell cycle sensor histidine kinase/response regulator CckA